MKVFISWSKPTSKQFASILRDWLPDVIQEVKPWMSSEDIGKGQRWAAQVGAQLGELGQGILCITAENQREPWLNFEAGALAKSLEDSRVRPLLLDLKPTDVTGPLAQFQSTLATDKDDMFRLVASLNEACGTSLEPDRLQRAFDRLWDDYLEKVQAIPPSSASAQAEARRSPDDLLSEVLERVRELQRSMTDKIGLGPKRHQRVFAAALGDGTLVINGGTVYHPKFGQGVAEMLLADPTQPPHVGVRFPKLGRAGRFVDVRELSTSPWPDQATPAEDGAEVVEAEA